MAHPVCCHRPLQSLPSSRSVRAHCLVRSLSWAGTDGVLVGSDQAAALLSTVDGLLAGVEAAAERRADMLARVDELELRREETAWLAVYEADEGRYKVRPLVL